MDAFEWPIARCTATIEHPFELVALALLEPMLRAMGAEGMSAVTALVSRVPDGPIRRGLLAVANPFIAAWRATIRDRAA
jgi:hypothetical protein